MDDADRLVVGDLPSGEYFATEVVGDSMDRIAPEGARVVVNASDRTPKDGNFYLFSLKGETTFKRYRSRPVRRLEPFSTNPTHEPIFLGEKGWHCIGRAVRSILDLQ
jgi:phage repressor protein C with HTH and peptisase S24 domain